uniref:Peptidase S54 rhomboid domain-containing protein n=1 Tax=Anopheles atroparvus TaxID=41427 RepID=A0A182JLY2_ANOAO
MSRSRRSSFGHQHYQQQFTVTSTINYDDGLCDGSGPGGGGGLVQTGGAPSSPSRFSESSYSNLGSRLTAYVAGQGALALPPPLSSHPTLPASSSSSVSSVADRYGPVDETPLRPCCISPAAASTASNGHGVSSSSDRYSTSSAPNSIMYPETRNGPHHRSMSPGSRTRYPVPERFRDPPTSTPPQQTAPTKVDQFGNYLMSNAPLLTTSESYNYLTSTVHTPVKRYIPTPPPPESFQHEATALGPSLMAGLMASGGGINIINHSQASGAAGPSLLKSLQPYRLKSKADGQGMVGDVDTTDHYATPPRARPVAGSGSKCQQQPICTFTGQPVGTLGRQSLQPEYAMLRAATPVSIMSEPMVLGQQGSSDEEQCYQCNSLRQATGVHQTTQTSGGPISPQPLSISTSQFFGVDEVNEEYEQQKWEDRQKRFAIRRFGSLKDELPAVVRPNEPNADVMHDHLTHSDRPDVLPAQSQDEPETEQNRRQRFNPYYRHDATEEHEHLAERKPSVSRMMANGLVFVVQSLRNRVPRRQKQWSRSFAPAHVALNNDDNDIYDGLTPVQEDEMFFDIPGTGLGQAQQQQQQQQQQQHMQPPEQDLGGIDNSHQIYMLETDRAMVSNGGWRTRTAEQQLLQHLQLQDRATAAGRGRNAMFQFFYGQRIPGSILESVLDNSRRPPRHCIKLLRPNALDERYDYRPFFTYWVNTTQILVLLLTLLCYGVGPIGIGNEQKSSQVLVTSLSLQTVQHYEQRNIWIGPRRDDLVHLGSKYAPCMRRDAKIMDQIAKTRKQERETACCIRNDDSGCVQSSQADCSVRGLWPTTISTWKKWSPGDSGPGGRISGSVCGLDPKYCDAPASVAPHEWPDDITKWPICRKNNQFTQRFRFKDHTAEHMVCEVIGHPCCMGISGECRITTREYCDFVRGYFHDEASLCSQVSCLNDVCGMFPFIVTDLPDQFYRLFTSLYIHAGIVHLIITVAFQHILLADLERLLGSLRTAIVYIGSGIVGNLTSAIFVPYKAEVGPLPSLAGTLSSLLVLLILCHWRNLKKPQYAMLKMLFLGCLLFGMGTLPWQQNFTGLISGLLFGTTFTLALTPYLSFTKYSRKGKIKLVWTCFVLHFVMYAFIFLVFYLFPTIFSLNFLDGNQIASINDNNGMHDHFNPYDTFNYFNGKHGDGGSALPGSDGGRHGIGGGDVGGGGGRIKDYDRGGGGGTAGGGGNRYGGNGGGGGGGGAISMSGGTIKAINPKYNNINSNGNLNAKSNIHSYKMVAICEKGQCNPRPNA